MGDDEREQVWETAAAYERAAVVAWLRGEAARRAPQPWQIGEAEALEYAADVIERGEHVEKP